MNYKNYIKIAIGSALLIAPFVISACKTVKVPPGVSVVDNFDIKSYAGKWYEIARFDFKHEKDLNQVTAEYSLNEDGTIKVLNKGFDTKKGEWKESEGKADFIGDQNKGALKVSFFGPFYSGYNVVSMDPAYENVLVFGESTDYIWFLSRNKTMPEKVKEKFIRMAIEAGYDMSRLVWTEQK